MSITPPFPIPVGQELFYCFAGTHTSSAGANCSASTTVTTGINGQTWSGPLGGPYTTSTAWSNFVVPSELSVAGAVIHSINPYIIFTNTYQYSQLTSASIDLHDIHLSPNGLNTLYFTHGTNLLSDIPSMTAFFNSQGTLSPPGGGIFGGAINEGTVTSFVAIAVYATIPRAREITVRRGYYKP